MKFNKVYHLLPCIIHTCIRYLLFLNLPACAFSPWFYVYKICSSSNIHTYEYIKIFSTKCLVIYWCHTILWVLLRCITQNFLLNQTHLELFLKILSPQHNPQGLILAPITTIHRRLLHTVWPISECHHHVLLLLLLVFMFDIKGRS